MYFQNILCIYSHDLRNATAAESVACFPGPILGQEFAALVAGLMHCGNTECWDFNLIDSLLWPLYFASLVAAASGQVGIH